MSRRLAREFAMKYLFQTTFNEEKFDQEQLQKRLELENLTDELDANNREYLHQVIKTTIDNLKVIDKYIDKLSENWKIDRLSKVDLSLLRIALSEIVYFEDIPYRVSINEAVELAKVFSSSESPSYINGILDKFVAQLENGDLT